MGIRGLLIAAALALFGASMPAVAQQQVTTTYGPFSVSSTSGTQLSNNVYSQVVSTLGVLRIQYNTSAGHCSDVRAHILVDGIERGLTGFLSAGQASGFVDVGPVSAGQHTVALQGEGRVSGCNSGVLAAWGGTMDVVTSVAAAQPAANIPAPGILATLLAFVAGALMFGPWRRKR